MTACDRLRQAACEQASISPFKAGADFGTRPQTRGRFIETVWLNCPRQETDSSDLDFVVELESGRSLLDLGGLQSDLEQLLGCAADVVTVKGLQERMRARVLEEAVPV